MSVQVHTHACWSLAASRCRLHFSYSNPTQLLGVSLGQRLPRAPGFPGCSPGVLKILFVPFFVIRPQMLCLNTELLEGITLFLFLSFLQSTNKLWVDILKEYRLEEMVGELQASICISGRCTSLAGTSISCSCFQPCHPGTDTFSLQTSSPPFP